MMTPGRVQRAFPPAVLTTIERAIKTAEAGHAGQIRFVVEGALDGGPLWHGQSARERAIDLFAQLRIWDTEHNNGVLIYLLLADRDVEIVADRGIHVRAQAHAWEPVCRVMEEDFRHGRFQDGVLYGIEAVARIMASHFPARSDGTNELSDQPILL